MGGVAASLAGWKLIGNTYRSYQYQQTEQWTSGLTRCEMLVLSKPKLGLTKKIQTYKT